MSDQATRVNALGELPWWTEADATELAVLVRELVDGMAEHRPACRQCASQELTGTPCTHVGKAIGVVVDWIERRELLSRARWIRRKREMLEFERDLLDLHDVQWR